MANRQTYLEANTLREQRLTLIQQSGTTTLTVSAPLPDNFGLTVGSEFSTPFDAASLNQNLSKALFLANISQKASLRMRKLYSNPTPTEISFDMEFTSFDDARKDVIAPVITLMAMAVGRKLTWQSLERKIEQIATKGQDVASSAADFVGFELNEFSIDAPEVDDANNVSKVFDLFTIIEGPPTTRAEFGGTMTIPSAFVTSVATKFSNVLDINGLPTSAICSVTLTPQVPPIYDDIVQYFSPGS